MRYRLLRWMPMAVADLVGEWFSTDLLQAAIAARGIFGSAAGPWSAGTGAALLLNAAIDPVPGGSTVTVKGGPGALTKALADAAREAGATIRVDAPVAQVLVRDGRAHGRASSRTDRRFRRDAVVSNADPRRTLLELVDPVELDPGFLQRIRNYRMPGTVAKVNLALSGLPQFAGVANPADLHGRSTSARASTISRRRSTRRSTARSRPSRTSTSPSRRCSIRRSCPPGPPRHVRLRAVRALQARGHARLADACAITLATTVVADARALLARASRTLIEHRQVLTPVDLEETYGLTRGHILHGEPALDQLFTMRPMLGWAQYRTPIDGLFLCGAGTHPGGRSPASPDETPRARF